MYEIHHRRSLFSTNDYALIGTAETIEEAKEKRVVSGDLVVHAVTHNVVQDIGWLWDWERNNPQSYAFRAIQKGV